MSGPRGRLRRGISSGDARRVRKLIEKYSLDIDEWIQVDSMISSPIALAACAGQRDIVELLLNAGANVNGVDAQGRTACHIAAGDGDIALLELLHAHNANMNAQDLEGETPLFVAARECKCRDERCAKRLVELGASLDDVFVQLAFACAGTAFIQMLIDADIDVGALYHPSWGTPLHWANLGDVEATMDMLVNVCGVDMNAVDEEGNTCCHNAVLNGSAHALRWLIDAGADFDVANVADETPLHLAATQSNSKHVCMCLLLAAGANVHATCTGGSTALHLAAEILEGAKAVEAVHLLLAGGADLDAIDASGDTPRQGLIECGDVKIDPAKIEAARRRIARTQLNLVRKRAMHICIGLQSLRLDALQLCEILQHAFGAMASMIAFHQWWAIATTVKHFK